MELHFFYQNAKLLKPRQLALDRLINRLITRDPVRQLAPSSRPTKMTRRGGKPWRVEVRCPHDLRSGRPRLPDRRSMQLQHCVFSKYMSSYSRVYIRSI